MPNPVVIATWPFGQIAARTALPLLARGTPALDAAIAGAQAVEDDPTVQSVGFGSIANQIGTLSLDACVMDGKTLSCGSVAGLENIRHAAALARRVMDKSPHIMLVGEGAKIFGIKEGFPLETLHTPESVARWYKERPKPAADKPAGHDTVTVLALDDKGNLGGVCTTSGLFFKWPGRVGDSPIIGAGLYVDNSAGSAGATGVGEEIIRIAGSHLIVEQLRAGKTPQEACEFAVRRVNQVAVQRGKHPAVVAFLSLDPHGRHGGACTVGSGFEYAVGRGDKVELVKAVEIPVRP